MSDSRITFGDIKQSVAELVKAKGWNKVHTPKNLAVSIAIEAGELMEVLQWANEDDQKEVLNGNGDGREKFIGEISDILIYIFCMANLLDIDLSDALAHKIAQNQDRFPDYDPSANGGRETGKLVIFWK